MFKMLLHKKYFWLIIIIFLIFSCTAEEKNTKTKPAASLKPYTLDYPKYFPKPHYEFTQYPLTVEGITLGKMLFYDPILSGDSTISCSSCHLPKYAFADKPQPLSVGVKGKLSQRNASALFNLIFYPTFFADGGVTHFEFIALAPMDNDREMHADLAEIMQRLNRHTFYKKQFKIVFGQEKINTQQFLYAMSQFLSTLISANSPYDLYIQGKTTLPQEALAGLKIFEQKCQTCHTPPLFTDLSFRNIGLDKTTQDIGRSRITDNQADESKFKVPSLRNVTLTSPYMHDGRFVTLTQVLEFYHSGTQNHPTLDPFLKQEGKLGISLTNDEKEKLIAFLQTLTDSTFIKNPDFQNPFLEK